MSSVNQYTPNYPQKEQTMNTKNLTLLFKTSLLAATMSMVVGCSDNPIPGTAEAAPTATKAIIIADPAVNCTTVLVGNTPATRVGYGQYTVDATASGKTIARGCIDTVSGADVGDLESDGDFDDDNNAEVITPITTMIEQIVATGATQQQARATAAQVLGVNELDLDKQPATNLNLQKAAAKITSTMQLVKASGGDANTSLAKIAEKLAKSTAESPITLDTALEDDTVYESVPENRRVDIKAANKKANDTINSATTVSQAVAVNKVVEEKFVKEISKLDKNSTISSSLKNLDNIANDTANEAATIEAKVIVVKAPVTVSGATAGN